MMPNLGQGGCQAMEDGFILTEMLKKASDVLYCSVLYYSSVLERDVVL